MMFEFGKILWFTLKPATLFSMVLAAFLVLSFWQIWPRFRKYLGIGIAAVLLFLACVPVPHFLLSALEARYSQVSHVPEDVAGFIVLSGYADLQKTHSHQTAQIGQGAERLLTTVKLAYTHPGARVIHSGKSGSWQTFDGVTDVDVARTILDDIQFPADRVEYETQSRNTYENALETRQVVSAAALDKTWVLMTSAFHMPRAMGCFETVGFTDVVAYPVDYRTSKSYDEIFFISSPITRLIELELPLREWMALGAYYVMGRTSSFFPGPV